MTAPRALIAEDEPLLAQALRQELRQAWPGLEVTGLAPDGLGALRAALDDRPDLLFLDIRMPGMDGLEVAQAVMEEWPDDGRPLPLIVFVTAYDQYAVQAFERHAVDYLLKPVQGARLAATCQRLQALLAQRGAASGPSVPDGPATGEPAPALDPLLAQLRQLLAGAPGGLGGALTVPPPRLRVVQAQVGGTVHLVPVEEVLYFEAADKYVRVVTAAKEHLIRLSLRELLPQLDPERFWQVHRGVVVQIAQVQQALRDEAGKVTLVLRGHPDRLTVSRLYAGLFKGM